MSKLKSTLSSSLSIRAQAVHVKWTDLGLDHQTTRFQFRTTRHNGGANRWVGKQINEVW